VQEFYIRQSEDADARGPFSIEQLSSLAETGQVNLETAYYDVDKEEWLPIGGNESLRTLLFPEKKKLRLKPKEVVQTLNPTDSTDSSEPPPLPITVTDMLAGAEGKDGAAKNKLGSLERARTLAAQLGLQLGSLLLLIHAVVLWSAERVTLLEGQFSELFTRPLFYAGLLDLCLGIVLYLGVSEAYAFVRIRAAAMLGFLTIALAPFGHPLLLPLAAVAAAASFTLTWLTRKGWVIAVGVIGVLSVLGLGWLLLQL
jgi:hypothetical protein